MLLTGKANPLTGAPGAVLLYVLAGLLLWPAQSPARRSVASGGLLTDGGGRLVWAGLWAGFAELSLQPANLGSRALSAAFESGGRITAGPLAHLDATLALASAGHAIPIAIGLASAELGIGLGMLHDRWRNAAAILGAALALAIWVTAEGMGGLTTGSATDPNSGPLLILLAAALYVPPAFQPRRCATAQTGAVAPRHDGRREQPTSDG